MPLPYNHKRDIGFVKRSKLLRNNDAFGSYVFFLCLDLIYLMLCLYFPGARFYGLSFGWLCAISAAIFTIWFMFFAANNLYGRSWAATLVFMGTMALIYGTYKYAPKFQNQGFWQEAYKTKAFAFYFQYDVRLTFKLGNGTIAGLKVNFTDQNGVARTSFAEWVENPWAQGDYGYVLIRFAKDKPALAEIVDHSPSESDLAKYSSCVVDNEKGTVRNLMTGIGVAFLLIVIYFTSTGSLDKMITRLNSPTEDIRQLVKIDKRRKSVATVCAILAACLLLIPLAKGYMFLLYFVLLVVFLGNTAILLANTFEYDKLKALGLKK